MALSPGFQYTIKLLAVLLEHLDGDIILSNEEIENAPDVEIRDIAPTDQVQLRLVKEPSTLWSE